MTSERENDSSKEGGFKLLSRGVGLAGVALLVVVIVVALIAELTGPSKEEVAALETRAVIETAAARLLEAATQTPVPITPPPCEAPHDWIVHTIQEGNSLYSLAERYGSDINTLMLVNCLESDLILIGQELYVPGLPTAQTTGILSADQVVNPEDVRITFSERFLNIVLLGSDKRQDDTAWRTDTIIVVSVDTERYVVRLLSVPRDLWVDIPGVGKDRINTADLWGEAGNKGSGPEMVKETIYHNLGIPIHYFVRVDFQGFEKIIDALGGVDIDVECPLEDIELMAGMHSMDGEQALLYARSRISTNDFDRSRRQRKLLMALWQQKLNKGIIPRIPALSIALSDAAQTDLPLDQLVSLAYVGLQMNPNQIFSQSIGLWQVENWTTPDGSAVLLPVHDEIKNLLDAFYGPIDFEFLDRIDQTRVRVQNGSWREQGASLAGTALGWMGLQVVDVGNADRQDYAESQVIVYNGDEAVAELVAQQLELPRTSLQIQPGGSDDVDIVVILGADYDPCAQ